MEPLNKDDLSFSNLLFRLTSKNPEFFIKVQIMAGILLILSGALYFNAETLGFTESFTSTLHTLMIASAAIAGTSQLTKK